VDHDLLQAERLLQSLDPSYDLVRGADGLCPAPRFEAGVRCPDIGGLPLQVFFVAVDPLEARVVPFEVVVLGRGELVVEVVPPLFGFLLSLSAVHPKQSGGLVGRQAQLSANLVEHPHLIGHLI
jgi:hypothetical protein